LEALQARIRPHFLFNSMNIIASLIPSNPLRAEEVVEDLSELFRASLKTTDRLVPFEEERLLCERYIGIERLRIGTRLQVKWQLDQALLEHSYIPPLTLQPIIENAIHHGIQTTAQGGVVEIILQKADDLVELIVKNPIGEPKNIMKEDGGVTTKGNQMALQNIVDRLSVIYGDRVATKYGVEGSVYQVLLRYPGLIKTLGHDSVQ